MLDNVISIALAANKEHSATELVDAVLTAKALKTLQVMEGADRKDDSLTTEIFKALAESKQEHALEKLTLSGLYSNGLRQNIWMPYEQTAQVSAAFPITQILVIQEASFNDNAEAYTEPECFYLGDVPLSPVKAVTGVFQYLASVVLHSLPGRREGTGISAAYCFACGPSGLEAPPGSVEVLPLPSSTYTIGKGCFHSSVYKGLSSRIRALVPGAWTIVASIKRRVEWAETENTSLQLKYALVSAKQLISFSPTAENQSIRIEESEIEVTDFRGFLSRLEQVDAAGMLKPQQTMLEDALRTNSRLGQLFSTMDSGPLLSVMSQTEACDTLNQVIADQVRVEEVARRAAKMYRPGELMYKSQPRLVLN